MPCLVVRNRGRKGMRYWEGMGEGMFGCWVEWNEPFTKEWHSFKTRRNESDWYPFFYFIPLLVYTLQTAQIGRRGADLQQINFISDKNLINFPPNLINSLHILSEISSYFVGLHHLFMNFHTLLCSTFLQIERSSRLHPLHINAIHYQTSTNWRLVCFVLAPYFKGLKCSCVLCFRDEVFFMKLGLK